MSLLGRLHERHVHSRRVRVLGDLLAPLLPPDGRVLDVGCGDGQVAREILRHRPDLELTGVEVEERPHTWIPVTRYDGRVLPYPDRSFDTVMYVDVLHHSEDPESLLREGLRVARRALVLKDHLCDGFAARPTLAFMDGVGNWRHGFRLVLNYWRRRQWLEAFDRLGGRVDHWNGRPPLYPWPASLLFGRSLHFVARILPGGGAAAARRDEPGGTGAGA